MNVAKQMKPVTLEEFEAMEKDERYNYELIDGIVMMSPSPSMNHQEIAHKIHGHLFITLKDSKCTTVGAYDIKFMENVYKPDIMVFCDNNKEVPEIIFEILSPSTRRYDLKVKLIKYEEMGVKEYWIVDPKVNTITIHNFILDTAETYGIDEVIQSGIRPEIIMKAADIFA